MTEFQPSEKFIAYYDVLGWKYHNQAAEEGRGMSHEELKNVLGVLKNERFEPLSICPDAPHIKEDVDFKKTCFSDNVVTSAEASPAGLINLVYHCSVTSKMLLRKGIMLRGYIIRGQISYDGDNPFGTGLTKAVEKEKEVKAFKQNADERGTPFIEIDEGIVDYVKQQSDQCVKEMFSRMVEFDEEIVAISSFNHLVHHYNGSESHDMNKELKSIDRVRKLIHEMKDQVRRHIDSSNDSAVQKSEHYIRFLDRQLDRCDESEESMRDLSAPYPGYSMQDIWRQK